MSLESVKLNNKIKTNSNLWRIITQLRFTTRKWFEPRSSLLWLKKIIWVIGVLRRTVAGNWRFEKLCRRHLQSQMIVLVSQKFKNTGEQFGWSIKRVATGKHKTSLAVKMFAVMQTDGLKDDRCANCQATYISETRRNLTTTKRTHTSY